MWERPWLKECTVHCNHPMDVGNDEVEVSIDMSIWLRWLFYFFAGVLGSVILVCVALSRTPPPLTDTDAANDHHTPTNSINDKDRLLKGNYLEDLWLVFGPADADYIFSEHSDALFWSIGEHDILLSLVRDMASNPNIDVSLLARPYAEAIVRIQWVRYKYPQCSCGLIVDRMAVFARHIALIIPASLALAIDTAVSSFPVISDAVIFYEMKGRRPSVHDLIEKIISTYSFNIHAAPPHYQS